MAIPFGSDRPASELPSHGNMLSSQPAGMAEWAPVAEAAAVAAAGMVQMPEWGTASASTAPAGAANATGAGCEPPTTLLGRDATKPPTPATSLPPAAGSEMETGVVMALGGHPFKRAMPRGVHMKTGLLKQDWEAVVDEVNAAIAEKIPFWPYIFKIIVIPLSGHVLCGIAIFCYFETLLISIMLVILLVFFLPATVSLVSLSLMPARVERAVAAARERLVDISERYRDKGFDFSLMDRKDYARRYIARPKKTHSDPGFFTLVVRRLSSHDFCMGGKVMNEFATDVPGEWVDRPGAPLTRRKVPKAKAKQRVPVGQQRAPVAHPRRVSGPGAV